MVGERIVYNISQGRKIFKFMKFLEPLRKITEESLLKKGKPILMRVLSVAELSLALGLYLSDNMVWFANMGLIKQRVKGRFSLEWHFLKDGLALAKNCVELLRYLFDALRNVKRQLDILHALSFEDDSMVSRGPTYELLRELISLRSKFRFVQLGTIQNLLRVVMLAYRLAFPWARSFVHPIAVCVCGVLSNAIAIMKLFREKKQVIKLKKANKEEG